MSKWVKVEPNLRYREHATRTHGKSKDKYYCIYYKGKEEAIGWASQGVTVKECRRLLATLRENWLTGTGGQTLAEMRELNLEQSAQEKEEKEKAASLTLEGLFFDGYLAKQQGKKKAETIAKEQGRMVNYIQPFFDKTSIYDVDAKLDDFITFLNNATSAHTGKPLSNQTKKHILNLISQIFTYAIARKKIPVTNPIKALDKRDKPSTKADGRERFLTKDEARELLAALAKRSIDTHDMALMSLFCGMRAGEILGLTWGCVNFEEKSLFLKDTKNKENRHAYMTPEIENMLQRRYDGQALDAPVFTNTEISKTFERAVKALGLNDGRADRREKVVFHTLRHTFASWHAKAGTPLYTIGKLLGHKTLAMTQRYAHLCPSAEKQAVMALHGALNEPQHAKVLPFDKAR